MDKLEQFLHYMQQVLLPVAIDIGSTIVFYNAIQHLGLGLFFCIVSCYCVRVIITSWNKTKTGKETFFNADNEDEAFLYIIFMIILAAIAIVLGIIGLVNITNIWNYVALFNPKLALAHELYGKALQLVK